MYANKIDDKKSHREEHIDTKYSTAITQNNLSQIGSSNIFPLQAQLQSSLLPQENTITGFNEMKKNPFLQSKKISKLTVDLLRWVH